jgi:hypothetical protein
MKCYCSTELISCQSFFSSNKTLPNAYIIKPTPTKASSISINNILVRVITLTQKIYLKLQAQLLYLITNWYCYTNCVVQYMVFLYIAFAYSSCKSGCGSLSKSLSRNRLRRDGDAEHTSLNLQPP